MNRRDLLINVLLLVVIGTLAFYIYEGGDEEAPTVKISSTSRKSETRAETTYDAKLGNQKFPNVGVVPIYAAILTPTPTPTPPPPKPTVTPNIHTAMGSWKLLSAMDGEALIEDRANKSNPETATFTMKLNETRQVTSENVTRTATLIKMDEFAENPNVTFKLDGTEAEHTLRMLDEPGAPPPAAAPPAAAPAGSPVAPTPQAPPGA